MIKPVPSCFAIKTSLAIQLQDPYQVLVAFHQKYSAVPQIINEYSINFHGPNLI